MPELFMPNDEMVASGRYKFIFGFDDDKVHYEITDTTDTQGLGPQRHTKDNRTGFTVHCLLTSAMQQPIHAEWHQTEDSVQGCLTRTLKHLGGEGSDILTNLLLALDRGYWTASLIDKVLELGCSVLGTCKQSDWFPFTFGPVSIMNCPRLVVSMNTRYYNARFRTTERYVGRLTRRKLTAVAYENGKSDSAALLISSMWH